MTITIRGRLLGGIALVGTSALVLAGCASAPAPASSGSASAAASSFVPCLVSDQGGFNDHSFNELAKAGLDKAAAEIGAKAISVQSHTADDYAPNLDSLASQGCNLIVSVGFNLSAATVKAATANPKINYAIIDDSLDPNNTGKNATTNGKPILFDTAQAAFLAGYEAASYSKTGVVGTFGGLQIPPVTIFMDGFAEGVAQFNKAKGKSVKVVGWDVAKQTGSFTGGFAAGVEAKTAAQGLLSQGADVLLPVGGPIYQSAAQAIRDTKNSSIALIGVDADVYNSDPTVKDLLLTSVIKGVDAGVHDVVVAASKGSFAITPYVGTLKNGGVGVAPFHDFATKVDPALQGEVDALKQQIISGAITVTSAATPK